MKKLLLLAALCAAPAAFAQKMAVQERGIDLSVEGQAVHAEGLTANGDVLLLVTWTKYVRTSAQRGRLWRTATATDTGSVAITLPYDIGADALYVAADVDTGRIAILNSPSSRFTMIPFDKDRLKYDPSGEIARLASPGRSAMIVLVRPKTGAWLLDAFDGGTNDEDHHRDGVVMTDPEFLQDVFFKTTAPKKIKKKDVLFVVDPEGGAMSSVEVDQ